MSNLVSILLLAHNKAAYTERCLNSLLQSSLRPLQLVLVNNGSTDSTSNLFQRFRQDSHDDIEIELITFETNLGAIQGRNRGMPSMKGDFWVFLDNDIVVRTRSWLEKLRGALERDPQLGLIGPKLVYPVPPHDIQCAGCTVTQGGQVIFCGRGEGRLTKKWNIPRNCQTLISACWMMKAEVAKKVGPLDDQFSPVQFEDIDYCYRIREAGWLCGYTPEVEMYHFENVTSGRTKALNYPYLTVKNGLKFKKKWGHRFGEENGPADGDWAWAEIPSVELQDVPSTLETIA